VDSENVHPNDMASVAAPTYPKLPTLKQSSASMADASSKSSPDKGKAAGDSAEEIMTLSGA